jgi:hypothetical protein
MPIDPLSPAGQGQGMITVRLNPARPLEGRLQAYLSRFPSGQRSAAIKSLAGQALDAADESAATPVPDVSVSRQERRQLWQTPEKPAARQAAELLGALNPGEVRLLETVAWRPYLCARELAAWVKCSPSGVRAGLRFLVRARAVMTQDEPSVAQLHAAVYVLTEFGALALAVRENRPLAELKKALGFGRRQLGYRAHTIEANGFFLALHARLAEGQLAVWRAEAASRVTLAYPGQRRPVTLRPDGYGEWIPAAGGRFPFYVEWDRHAGNLAKLREKLRLYLAHYTALLAGKDDQIVIPRLLFVACDSSRMQTVWTQTQALRRQSPYAILPVLLTCRELVWQHGPLASIWELSPGGEKVGPWTLEL